MISLENSVRQNKAAMTVLDSLSKGANFGIVVENCEKILVSREKEGVLFKTLADGDRPDFVITVPEKVFCELFSEGTSLLKVDDFLTFSAKTLVGAKEGINLVIYANFLKLTFHGYPKLLKLGGVSFLKVLADNGAGSLLAIEKKLATFRNK
ncbi:hypothetical protein J5690_05900 [bacterium]|nr:hypothetical protein [bacterium]